MTTNPIETLGYKVPTEDEKTVSIKLEDTTKISLHGLELVIHEFKAFQIRKKHLLENKILDGFTLESMVCSLEIHLLIAARRIAMSKTNQEKIENALDDLKLLVRQSFPIKQENTKTKS